MSRILESAFVLASVFFLILAFPWGSVRAATRSVDGIVQPLQDGYLLIPLPQEVAWLDEDFQLAPPVSIVLADEAAGVDLYAARDLQKDLDRLGVESVVLRASELVDPQGAIVIGEAVRNPWVARLIAPHGGDWAEALPPEGYRLIATPEYVVIAGSDVRGTYWGTQTLRQLIAGTTEQPVVRGVDITDWPDFPIRALHMFAGVEGVRLQHQVIEDVMARFKLNTLILQVDQAKWESHPEIWASQDPLRRRSVLWPRPQSST